MQVSSIMDYFEYYLSKLLNMELASKLLEQFPQNKNCFGICIQQLHLMQL